MEKWSAAHPLDKSIVMENKFASMATISPGILCAAWGAPGRVGIRVWDGSAGNYGRCRVFHGGLLGSLDPLAGNMSHDAVQGCIC
eukprot:13774613-Alexandrium_andersonii.AAC.1